MRLDRARDNAITHSPSPSYEDNLQSLAATYDRWLLSQIQDDVDVPISNSSVCLAVSYCTVREGKIYL